MIQSTSKIRSTGKIQSKKCFWCSITLKRTISFEFERGNFATAFWIFQQLLCRKCFKTFPWPHLFQFTSFCSILIPFFIKNIPQFLAPISFECTFTTHFISIWTIFLFKTILKGQEFIAVCTKPENLPFLWQIMIWVKFRNYWPRFLPSIATNRVFSFIRDKLRLHRYPDHWNSIMINVSNLDQTYQILTKRIAYGCEC